MCACVPIKLLQHVGPPRESGTTGRFHGIDVLGSAIDRGLTFRMAQTPVQHYLPKLLERIVNGDIDPSFVITHGVPLERGPEMYKTFREKQDGCIKVVMQPRNGGRSTACEMRRFASSPAPQAASDAKPAKTCLRNEYAMAQPKHWFGSTERSFDRADGDDGGADDVANTGRDRAKQISMNL
jgi:hypothetical protein